MVNETANFITKINQSDIKEKTDFAEVKEYFLNSKNKKLKAKIMQEKEAEEKNNGRF